MKCCFSVLKAIDPVPFQSYKEGCNQSRCSTERWMCLPLSQIRGCTDQQDLGEAASQRGTVTPGSCPALPLGKAPTEFQTLLDWTLRLPLSALHPGGCAKFCCSLAYLFASVYSLAPKQVCINLMQTFRRANSALHDRAISWSNLHWSIRMYEGGLVSELPAL